MGKIRVLMDPEQRQKYVDYMLMIDGLPHIEENPLAAYCPISLTSVPDELKPYLKSRQDLLMNNVLAVAGITAYDPGSAPFSPDRNLTTQPNAIYAIDSGKIAGARFFVGHDILPSDGKGVERERAKTLNRVSVMILDKGIRVSRMQPHRTIYLQYWNFLEQAHEFVPLFRMLKQYDPGMGFNDNIPVLLGFERSNGRVVDLEETVYREFSHLQYVYDGKVPILRLRAENPESFYENAREQLIA